MESNLKKMLQLSTDAKSKLQHLSEHAERPVDSNLKSSNKLIIFTPKVTNKLAIVTPRRKTKAA